MCDVTATNRVHTIYYVCEIVLSEVCINNINNYSDTHNTYFV